MRDYSALLDHYRSLPIGQADGKTEKVNIALSIQQQAIKHLKEIDFPHKKIEAWHYTSLNQLLAYPFAPADEDEVLSYSNIEDLVLGQPEDIRIVLYNGKYQPNLSHIPESIEGLHIESMRTALARADETVIDHLGKLSGEGEHLFNALNTALIQDGVYIHVEANTRIEQPIEILHVSLSFSGALMAQPRNLVILEEHSTATIVENYSSLGDSLCFNNVINEIFIGSGASLNHPRLQDESRQTRHLAALYIQQDENSHYQCTTSSLGALWSRTEFHIDLSGAGADCQLHGLYLAGDNQANHNHLQVSHTAPSCSSREFFKGILQGHGRAVFDGLVMVQADAQQTDAHLSNANLLLSRDAEIDTKPVLEINADDVQCSHGTTVGQIDQDMLFYLRARGIPENRALQMICQGFAAEILEHYDWEPLRLRARSLLEQRLHDIENIHANNHENNQANTGR